MTNNVTLATLLACAHDLADTSRATIRPYFRTALAVTNKAPDAETPDAMSPEAGGATATFDPVTVADQAAERAITRRLQQLYPDHGIVGEEYGATRPDARYQWIVDPIDGTRAFIMGLPTWGTLIGLLDGGRPILGLMDQPFTGERYFASSEGAFLRHGGGSYGNASKNPSDKIDASQPQRLATRGCLTLRNAIFSSTHPDLFDSPRSRRVLEQLRSSVQMTRYGGDCYAYCQLAAGHIDLIVEPGLQAYDIAPLIPIIEAAGGRVTDWDGGPAHHGGDIVAAGDPRLHAATLALIQAA